MTLCMYNKLNIVFDLEKDRYNQLKHHGLSLEKASELQWETAVFIQDQRQDYGEKRFIAWAYLDSRLYVVIFVDRGIERRIISLRKANYREVQRYAKT